MKITEVTCRTILNPIGGYLLGYTHTINPYYGCSLGGTLCGVPDYAPEIARVRGETRPWGSWLDAKTNAPQVYAADHDRVRRSAHPEIRIYMSSVTDPWVPQEKGCRVTRRILEQMTSRPPDLLALQTHTPNALWDIDLLEALSQRFPLCVQISVETDRETLGPPFPPHAYSVAARLEALATLRARGITTVGVVAPLWPIDDIGAFARRLEASCDFVVVDHFLVGDGSRDGARTRRRLVLAGQSFPDLLTTAGYEEWTRLEALDRVAGVLRDVLGPQRVGVSRQGFQEAARCALQGAKMAPMRRA
jgi:DNA repair photolyase